MLQSIDNSLSQEVKTRRNQSKYDGKLSVDAIVESTSEKEEISTCSSKSNCYPTADGIKTEIYHSKLHSTQTSQGEKKSVPIKEYCMWNPEDVKNPEALRCKEMKPQGLNMLNPNGSGSLTSKSLLLFPPVKDATPNGTSDTAWKNKTIISQKMLNGTSVEIASYNQDAKAAEQKGKKGTDVINDQAKKKIELHKPSLFVPSHTEVSILQEDPEQSHWHCALAANKNIATISNHTALEKNAHPACKQLPHTEGIQHTKHYDIQSSLTNNVRNRYVGVKQEKEEKIQEVPPLSGLLPSLMASHVARTTLPSRLT
ncbi:uncharacterized protein LOC134145998 [Rhea pennata]|uniref:uncharacterized protein LOC134145998 n=1 Tax=Rhea pennata TaxID=8795 RepID=UPI002E272FB0